MRSLITLLPLALLCLIQSSISAQLKVIVWADISSSITNNSVERLSSKHLEPLVFKIQEDGGALVVGNIGNATRDNLAILMNNSQKESFPKQKPTQSASEYQKILLKYLDRKRNHKQRLYSFDLTTFQNKLKTLTDYTHLASQSDVAGAIDVSHIILNEQDGFEDAEKYILTITDGLDTGSGMPKHLPKNATLLVVNRFQSAGDLERYPHLKFATINGAISYILNQ